MTTEIIISVISIILSGIISSVITISVQKSIKKRETDHRLFLKKVDSYQDFIESMIDFFNTKDEKKLIEAYKKMGQTILLYGKNDFILEWNTIMKETRLGTSDTLKNLKNLGKMFKAIRKDLGYNENIDGLAIVQLLLKEEIPKK